MRKLSLFTILLLVSIAFLPGCKKTSVEETYIPVITPVMPDFTTLINASVTGFITDENGQAVEGASVKGGQATVVTDRFGHFNIVTAAFSKSAGFLQVSKAGYFTGYRTFLPIEGTDNFVRLQLIPKTIVGSIASGSGGTVTTPDGATVSLPADAVVVAATNSAYNGTVSVAVHWLDPSDMAVTQATMPGDLRGVDSTGHLKALITYGMLGVELTGSAGELLQIAPGKKSALHFPLPAAVAGTAPSTIPLWYFDETNGLWKQDGNAVKNGAGYDGAVSHFSFWNCDVGFDLVNFSIQLTNAVLEPLANTAISIALADQPNSARLAYTNVNGEVSGMVPANSSLIIKIIPTCNDAITVTTIQTLNVAVDLGTVQINMQPAGATVQGTVLNCNGDPLVSGFVIIQQGNAYSSVNVTNGAFNAAVPLCVGSSVSIIAVDNETASESEAQALVLAQGVNDVGELTACSPPSGEYINYVLDGVSKTLNLPLHLFTANFFVANNILSVNAAEQVGAGIVFGLDIDGPDVAGTHTLHNNQFQTDSLFVFTTPLTMTINQFGLVGEYIDGTYSGIIKAVSDNSVHTLSFTIHVKRDF